jgi:fatty acid desaturase
MDPVNVSLPQAQRGSDYAELSRTIKHAGLLRRRHGYYIAKFAVNAALLGAGWAVFGLLGASWWQLVTAVFLGVVTTQLSFVAHDAGHRQIFDGRRANDVVGYLHASIAGVSYGWWIGKHNRHHANPNQEGEDPDIQIAALSFSVEQASTRQGFLRWTTKYQAFLFFPMLTLEGINLHVAGVRAIVKGKVKAMGLEFALLVAHIVVYLTAVFVVLPPLQAIVFIAVHQGTWGLYMGCSFAPNHKGMAIVGAEEKLDYLSKQVLTSRNVRGGLVTDFVLGGLNYQIEHHLFPSMPRPNLRHAQILVREFCDGRDIPYVQGGAFASYAEVIRHLHEVGNTLRQRTPVPQEA